MCILNFTFFFVIHVMYRLLFLKIDCIFLLLKIYALFLSIGLFK